MAAQRAGKAEEKTPPSEAAKIAALATPLSSSARSNIRRFLDAGATIERDSVEWRALLLLRDGRSISVFRHHLDEVTA